MLRYLCLFLIPICTGCNLIMYYEDHPHQHNHNTKNHEKNAPLTLQPITLPSDSSLTPPLDRGTFDIGVEGDWQCALSWVEKAVATCDRQTQKSADLLYRLIYPTSNDGVPANESLDEKVAAIKKAIKEQRFFQVNPEAKKIEVIQNSWQNLFDNQTTLTTAHITTAQLRHHWPAWKIFPVEPENVFPNLTPQLKKTPTMADFDKKKRQAKLLLAAFRQISGKVPDLYPPLPKLEEE